MKAIATAVTLLLYAGHALAADAPSEKLDRLTMMVSSASLSGSTDVSGVRIGGDDGGGASIGWLHNFNAHTIAGLGAEYQTIGDAHWTFGSANIAYGWGGAEHRTNVYADGHVGSGRDNGDSFDYATYTVGLIQNITHQFAVILEDKQIDIDTTHGNLPKVGVQYVWSPKFVTVAGYAHSFSDDLGTKLWTARGDYYGKHFNLLFGGATGKATPAVTNLQTNITIPGLTTHEGFLGVTKPFSRMEVTLLGDYLKIADIKRLTITLNGTVRLNGP